ncbi:MAG TPA: TIGR00300 family protein [Fimbriimonadaceae bacterium]|nr:TIGR00300 family protein [Fimbriimonadaceae bacterium]
MITERISIEGHLIDEQTLNKVFSTLDAHGVRFQVKKFRIGENSTDPSLIELILQASNAHDLGQALSACRPFGAEFSIENAEIAEADVDGVLPEGFYSTTNFTTEVRIEDQWLEVENIEMDCGIRVWKDHDRWRAETRPMHAARARDQFVVGFDGVRVVPDESEERDEDEFRFMANEVSSERPKGRMIAHCAAAMRTAKEHGKKVLLVGGPAIIHSGCAGELSELIRLGWIDVLFAGNALAAHDIEAAMLGTSLGVDLEQGRSVPHGHTHHLRAINRVRRAGSIAAAVQQGLIPRGVMYTCVKQPIPFVLCGSIRDDGPLPDVITDNVRAQDAMRAHLGGVGVALMVATTLHSVATGNILPASVKTYCVDSDADTVIKLTDRGTHQAVGLVTDCEFFVKQLLALLRG